MLASTFFPVLALSALSVNAISITEPTSSDNWALDKSQEIRWTSVNTDPSNFTIYLELANSTSSAQNLLQSSISTSSGEYSYTPKNLPSGQGYRVNFVASNGGILAQSGYFAISSAEQVALVGVKWALPVVFIGALGYFV